MSILPIKHRCPKGRYPKNVVPVPIRLSIREVLPETQLIMQKQRGLPVTAVQLWEWSHTDSCTTMGTSHLPHFPNELTRFSVLRQDLLICPTSDGSVVWKKVRHLACPGAHCQSQIYFRRLCLSLVWLLLGKMS
uniref:Transposase n=1 Tax=Steinernema glaseri TaxID=37863 RepID=A0A1I7ZWX6_9BILA